MNLQVNKLEQVTSDCHQMSLGGGEGAFFGGCTVRANTSWVMVTWVPPSHPPDRLTDIYRTENITFPQEDEQ